MERLRGLHVREALHVQVRDERVGWCRLIVRLRCRALHSTALYPHVTSRPVIRTSLLATRTSLPPPQHNHDGTWDVSLPCHPHNHYTILLSILSTTLTHFHL